MSWTSKWATLGILIIILLEWGRVESTEETKGALEIISAASHQVLSGDLTVMIVRSSGRLDDELERELSIDDRNASSERLQGPFILKVLYLVNDISESIGEIYVEALTEPDANISIVIPCGFFSRGGIYSLNLQYKSFDVPLESSEFPATQASKVVDVKWPKPSIFLESQHFATYPSKPAVATIKYNGIACRASNNVPEAVYLLQLIYCGSTIVTCYPQNNSHAQVLYHEEVRGFASPRVVSFRCELFGLPGNYAVRLTAANHNPDAPTTSVYIKVDWSVDYDFNVHARSIYPCEGSGGVSVLFQYPSCRLQGDRVRVFGRLRADVTSLASPSSLHYVTELRSLPGKHSLTFDCEIFTEKYVEYCFVYVSQAITGAMADVKMTCIPTFPFQESDAAGWGPWSAWSPCSSSCLGGIRNRYRFCDAPPPKYGAKFCQGKTVETEFCRTLGPDGVRSWSIEECKSTVAATRPEVTAEVGAQCRCGCIVNLQEETVRKMIAANTQACPGRSFWLLQADEKFLIGLHLDQLQFPCPGQYFRVRDGDSLSGELLRDVAYDRAPSPIGTVISKGRNLLLEFFSDELTASGEGCIGGFLAHAAVVQKQYIRNGNLTLVPFNSTAANGGRRQFFLRPAHFATAAILLVIILVSLFLTLQFFLKYRKYRIAEDLDNYSDTSELVPGQSKSYSVTTSFSDIPSMIEITQTPEKKLAPCEVEEQYVSTETLTGCNEGSNISSSTLKLRDTVETSSEKTITSARSTSSSKFHSVSSVIVHAPPEVKYAYPVKLRTLGLCSSSEDNSTRGNDDVTTNENKPANSEHQKRPGLSSDSKDSSSTSILSGSSTSSALKTGKETKDRRNRERLLQRPNSDFSLTNQSSDMSLANQDSELELDYYDYNVANASAVPGSYLGMDPAFLVWIPPFDCTDPDNEMDDLYPEQPSKRSSVLTLNTEGASLTPSEYQRMKLSSLDQLKINFHESDDSLKREDRSASTSGSLKDTNPEDLRPRYVDKLLSTRRTFQGTKHSTESLGMTEHRSCVIPNRLECKDDRGTRRDASVSDGETSTTEKSCGDRRRFRDYSNEKRVVGDKPKASGVSKDLGREEVMREDSPRAKGKVNQKLKEESHSQVKRVVQRGRIEDANLKDSANNKYREFIQSAQPYGSGKIEGVGIPMTELSGGTLKSIVQVRRIDNREVEREKDVQSPDYGIEMPAKSEQDSFYGLLSGNDDIKFADDDDEYGEEPVNA